jgi:hypothetical protein
MIPDIIQPRRLVQGDTRAASMMLLSTSIAAKFLRQTKQTTYPFPETYLLTSRFPLDLESRGMLRVYARELLELEMRAFDSSLRVAKMTASGFGTLASSIEVVAYGSAIFLREGRQLWQAIMRGLPGYGLIYREMMNPGARDEDIALDLFVPTVLVPSWKNGSELSCGEVNVPSQNEDVTPASGFGSQQTRSKPPGRILNKLHPKNWNWGGATSSSRSLITAPLPNSGRGEPAVVDVPGPRQVSPGSKTEGQILSEIRAALNSSD